MRRSPTLVTLLVLALVFLTQRLAGIVGVGPAAFALALPLNVRPWTLVTSVYAHGSLEHLGANAVALALFGLGVERTTTPLRYHAYFLFTGALAGIVQVVVAAALWSPVSVYGASGAVFALFGYVFAGNFVARGTLRVLTPGVQALVIVVLAAVITLATASPNVAVVAHFTGFLLGLVAGRLRLLHVPRSDPRGL